MPHLSIKNVPEPLVAELRARAEKHHRSLQGELMSILEAAVWPRPLSVAEARAQLERLALGTPDEATVMVRADRDAR